MLTTLKEVVFNDLTVSFGPFIKAIIGFNSLQEFLVNTYIREAISSFACQAYCISSLGT